LFGPSIRLGQEQFVIDVLPDFVGYWLIAINAQRLVPLHAGAKSVRNLALVLNFLSIPACVQYTVVTAQSGGITRFWAPLWPLAVALALLDLILVWKLCGLTADLARALGDQETERAALSRRGLYVVLRILLAGGAAAILVAPAPVAALWGANALMALGLLVMALMMGLMRRAEKMCRPHSAVLAAGEAGPSQSARLGFRRLSGAGIVVPLGLAIAAFFYYVSCQRARDEARANAHTSTIYSPIPSAFYEHLENGRLDEAYQSTTTGFRSRVSPDEFANLVQQYLDYKGRAESPGGGAGSRFGGYDYLTEYDYKQFNASKMTRVTLTIRRERDTILSPTPPAAKVDEFLVEEIDAPGGSGP
jgi:hypothetical protein